MKLYPFFISVLSGYFFGAVPFAFIVTKIFKKVDIRTLGSGNPGATNVYRSVGKAAGILTLALDLLKGFLPVLAIKKFFGVDYAILAGLFSILGHTYTVFLNFRGGKGIATAAGVYLAVTPIAVLIAFAGFIAAFSITKYVSVGSITAAVALLVAVFVRKEPPNVIIVTAIAAALVIYRHRPNIKRLIEKKEIKTQI